MSQLVAYREKLNLTQEELSEKSGVSVRTIQRVESGIDPKGYTLKALAKALEVDEAQLLQKEVAVSTTTFNINNLINLSTLPVVFIPIVNVAVPLFIALLKQHFNAITKQLITLQILWAIVMLLTFVIGNLINFGNLGRDIIIGALLLLVLVNAFMIIRNSIELNKNNQLYFYVKFNII
ncbi:helix-turn-helix domain-containing protein [Aquimarina brevivitae]|uniref:Helix-turn-helix protein n=1 Tax=Aquimarina brevivitae TaxID=323412 RepID=A0A4Q7P3H6_9FLAO|nr:helix-turn-helix transcriptional regulator [Aquimarina brevivitae]RZS93938.1 helix-turn-helix protein [Aquimarina brevivitae]